MIVLDTHALIWWANQDRLLSAKAKSAIEGTLKRGGEVKISAISAWEVAMLVQRSRLALAMDLDEWLQAVTSIEGVTFVPISARTAAESARLPGAFHPDPADRMIVALARELNAPLVTADEKIQRYGHVRWIW